MKNILLIISAVTFILSAHAQETKPVTAVTQPVDYHSHRGFHFEFGVGPAFGSISEDFHQGSEIDNFEFSGTGTAIELKFGGGLQDNLVLTIDLLNKVVVGPDVTKNGITEVASNNYSLSEVTYCGDLTYYLLPSDFFFSGAMGVSRFVLDNSSGNMTISTKYGFSMQLKAGKHWWLGSKWGFSLGAAYGFSNVNNSQTDVNGPATDQYSSSRFTITASIGVH